MDRADVRVIQRGRRASFTKQSVTAADTRSVRQELQGDRAVEDRVARKVDLTHAARPEA